MNVHCARCGKKLAVGQVSTSEEWPLGWQLTLSHGGEVYHCSHACAAAWHSHEALRERAQQQDGVADWLADTVPLEGATAPLQPCLS